jgi:hypothetical protein
MQVIPQKLANQRPTMAMLSLSLDTLSCSCLGRLAECPHTVALGVGQATAQQTPVLVVELNEGGGLGRAPMPPLRAHTKAKGGV